MASAAKRKSAQPAPQRALGRPSRAPARAATDSTGGPVAPAKAAKGRALSAPAGGAKMAAVPPPADDQPIRPVKTQADKKRAKEAEAVARFRTASVVEAAKQKYTKRGKPVSGTVLPPAIFAVKSSKEVEWKRGDYAVFMDHNSYSCIRVSLGSVIEFIPMSAKALDVHRQDARRFEDRWKPYIYPLMRAATVYVEGARSRGITEEARDHLQTILGTKLDDLKLVSKEELHEMKKKAKEDKKAAKAAKQEPSVTVTTVKNGEKTVEKTNKVPKPGKPEEAAPKVKILSREEAAKLIKAGGKMKSARTNDARKGTLRAAAIDAIQGCATVDAALKASYKWKGAKQAVKFTDVRSAVRRGYVTIAKK